MDNIDNSDSLASVGTYLTGPEAEIIKSNLEAMNIPYVVEKSNPVNHYNKNYYEIKVKRKHGKTASQVVGKIRAKDLIERRKCPKCRSSKYREVEHKTFWQKLYYLGTTLVQCQKCKTRYPI